MNINKILGWFSLMVGVISVLFTPVHAQDAAKVTPLSSLWVMPTLPCSATESCRLLARVDKNGTLYINDAAESKLYIAQANGLPPQIIDLAATNTILGISFGEFIPFEDGTIFFEMEVSPRTSGLYLYNYQSQELIVLNPPIPGRVTSCTYNVSMINRSFYRLGSTGKRIVVCSISDDGIYNINVINVSSQTLEETIPTVGTYAPGLPLWAKIQGGDDGDLYIQIHPGIQYPFLNESKPSDPEVLTYVARHTPGTTSWSVIPISRAVVAHISSPTDMNTYLVGVDTQHNLYLSISWMIDNKIHSEIQKLTSQGELVWRITEAELENVRYFTDFLGEDQIFTSTIVSVNDIEGFLAETQPSVPTLVPTNAAPVANAGTYEPVTDTDANGSEAVTVDASASTDGDGSIAAYSWSENGTESQLCLEC